MLLVPVAAILFAACGSSTDGPTTSPPTTRRSRLDRRRAGFADASGRGDAEMSETADMAGAAPAGAPSTRAPAGGKRRVARRQRRRQRRLRRLPRLPRAATRVSASPAGRSTRRGAIVVTVTGANGLPAAGVPGDRHRRRRARRRRCAPGSTGGAIFLPATYGDVQPSYDFVAGGVTRQTRRRDGRRLDRRSSRAARADGVPGRRAVPARRDRLDGRRDRPLEDDHRLGRRSHRGLDAQPDIRFGMTLYPRRG